MPPASDHQVNRVGGLPLGEPSGWGGAQDHLSLILRNGQTHRLFIHTHRERFSTKAPHLPTFLGEHTFPVTQTLLVLDSGSLPWPEPGTRHPHGVILPVRFSLGATVLVEALE